MCYKKDMGLISVLFQDPFVFLLLALPLLFSIIIHEYAHGYVALKMGDTTALYYGRLTLNPKNHLDPIGTIFLFIFGFGWAKPVPVNFYRMRDVRKGLIYVSSAGIAANLVLAFAAFFLMKLISPLPFEPLRKALFYTANINIMLASFNLIPIPPLDGSKILMGLSRSYYFSLSRLEPYGMYLIIILLLFGILDPIVMFFRWMILGLIEIIL